MSKWISNRLELGRLGRLEIAHGADGWWPRWRRPPRQPRRGVIFSSALNAQQIAEMWMREALKQASRALKRTKSDL